MRKQKWQQAVSMLLVAVMLLGTLIMPQTVSASEQKGNGSNQGFYGANIFENNNLEKLLNQESEYNVTEEEVAEVEKAYEEAQSNVIRPMSGSNAIVADFAQKKATILTALYGLDSIQYALIEDGEITVAGTSGYNNKEEKQEVKTSTMYGIASISKMFTTTAVLQLVEAGKVDLDAPVTTYITDFKMADERYKDITVRMLLNHSSGIMGGSLNNSLLFEDNDTLNHDQLLKSLSTQRLKANPGDYSVYCNDGFSLAEILVERVTGQTFSEYVAENITGPLELTGTKSPQDSFKTTKLAGIYEGKTKLPAETFNSIGTGGYYSTASNLCRFAEVFMDSATKADILTVESVAAMEEKAVQGADWTKLNALEDGYGLGWDFVNVYPFNQYGIKAVTKGGDSLYYHGSLVVLPEENKAVAVLSSAGSSTIDQIFASAILMQALYEDGTITELPSGTPSYGAPVRQTIPIELAHYKGYYVTMGGILEVEMDPTGILTLSNVYDRRSQVQLIYTGNGKFRDATGLNEYQFVTEGNGEMYLWGGGYATLPGIGTYFGEYYQAQKIDDNIISEDVKEIWKERVQKQFFIINEKYSSVYYIKSGAFVSLALSEKPEGYMAYSEIKNASTAVTDILLPGMIGRDLQDYTFYTEDGIEYAQVQDFVLISEDGVKTLSSKDKYNITIGKDGYAKWYKVGKKTAGKTMKVTVPENGAYAVYDANGICQTHSYVSGKTKIKLPEGGYVVFAGDAKAKFTVKISKSK